MPASPSNNLETADSTSSLQRATFAVGCFWHIEEVFRKVKGVKETIVGYTGGTVENPTYE